MSGRNKAERNNTYTVHVVYTLALIVKHIHWRLCFINEAMLNRWKYLCTSWMQLNLKYKNREHNKNRIFNPNHIPDS